MKCHTGFPGWLCVFVAALCGSLACPAAAQDQPPTVDGNISVFSSSTDFYVDGKHIVTNAQTTFLKPVTENGQNANITDPAIAKTLAVGDHVQVFGDNDRRTHSIVASTIVLQPLTHDHIAGFAVVQKVLATSPQLILEADGYRIAITPKTTLHNKPPLNNQTIPVANMWIDYKGRWNQDGLVVAEHADYSQFAFSERFKKGLDKSKAKLVAPIYGATPAATSKDGEIVAPYLYAKKHTVSIPANLAVQQRLQQIGERLIPASQKILANDDPQKVHFQFYAVDGAGFPVAIGSPDGLVILPVQTINALQSDDQIAAVLSEGVAEALEWQVPPAATGNAGPAMIAVGEMPIVGPIAGIALISGGLFESYHGTYATRFDPWQHVRVGLSLMHDAGYDIRQAPLAWQILQYGIAKQAEKPPSLKSAYLLNIIGLEYAHDGKASSDTPQAAAK